MKSTEISSPERVLTVSLSERSRGQRRERKDALALESAAAAPRRNDLLPAIKLEQRALSSLHAPERELRRVDARHVAEIVRSIAAFGFVRPILIAGDGKIVDGVSSVQATKTLGLETVPCLVVDHLNSDEIRLVRMALNRLGEKGIWDVGALKIEFAELLEHGAPIELAGFSPPEIDVIVMQDEAVIDEKANSVPDIDESVPAVSQHGDVWKLGRHRLICADATSPASYARLFADAPPARALFGDPPYNIKIDGFAVGAGSIRHREFATACGEMSDDEFVTFLANFLTAAEAHLVDGGVLFVCMDWRHSEHVQRAARQANLSHLNTVVWAKGNGGLGGLYRSAHEFVLVLKKGEGQSTNNVKLGMHGRDRTNVWSYPGANQHGSSANAESANHPTPKPVELVADALVDVTDRGEIVIDPFAGSGTTVIAAERTGRTAYAMELDPVYVDLIIRRFEKFTGLEAVHLESGQTFAQLTAMRRSETTANDAAVAEHPNMPLAAECVADPISELVPSNELGAELSSNDNSHAV